MKAFSLWLFKRYWAREIVHAEWATSIKSHLGEDYDAGFLAGVEYALETLCPKEPK